MRTEHPPWRTEYPPWRTRHPPWRMEQASSAKRKQFERNSGAEQINAAIRNVSEISVKNREGIDKLIKEVSRFKVE